MLRFLSVFAQRNDTEEAFCGGSSPRPTLKSTRNKVTTGAGRGIVFRLILAFTIPLSKFVCRGDLWSPVLFCDCLRAINDRPYE